MRESCSCGAGVHSLSRRWVREWRAVHRCDPKTLLNQLKQEVDEIELSFEFEDEEDEGQ